MQFKDIVGQRLLINHLTQIIDSGRVSHAQLFLGENGCGSLALAVAYAQYLNCSSRQHYGEGSDLRADSCGECPSCKKIQQLVHPDLHFVFPNISTAKDACSEAFEDQFREFALKYNFYADLEDWYNFLGAEKKQGTIRERDAANILRTLSMKPYESDYKVLILWMAEKMNISAANTLLKTLEEPTPNTVILLVAEEADQLLPTITSRAQLVKVNQIDDPTLIDGNYVKTCHFEQQGRDDFAGMFVTWMRQLFKLNMQNLSSWVDKMSALGREQQKLFLSYALDAIRACLLKNLAGVEMGRHWDFHDEKFNNSFPTMITPNNAQTIAEAISDAIYYIERNAYSKITFMQLSFNISKALKKR